MEARRPAGPGPPQVVRHPPTGVLRVCGAITVVAGLVYGVAVYKAYKWHERKETEKFIFDAIGSVMQEENASQAAQPQWLAVSMAARYLGAALEGAGSAYIVIAGLIGVAARPRRSTWHLALAGWVVVLCSLLTIVGIAALVNWAGYPSVPSKTLLLIVLAQSSFGWLLLLVLAALRRR